MGFLDGLTKKGAEISNSLQESMNKSQRESKCKKTINENKSKIEEAYSEIGKKVYEEKKISETLMGFINEKIEEIDQMLKSNEELKKEILMLNNKKICPNCGTEVEINATFCPQCGKEQEKIEVEQFVPKGKRKCSGCSEIIDEKNEFCPNCGAKKEVVVEEKNEEKEEVKENTSTDKKPKEKNDEKKDGKRKCAKCGEMNDESDMFCANCGAKKED